MMDSGTGSSLPPLSLSPLSGDFIQGGEVTFLRVGEGTSRPGFDSTELGFPVLVDGKNRQQSFPRWMMGFHVWPQPG